MADRQASAAGRARSPTSSSPTAAIATTSTAGCSGRRGIKPLTARRGTAHGSGLGPQRCVVERGFAHAHNFRPRRICQERYAEIHTALLVLA